MYFFCDPDRFGHFWVPHVQVGHVRSRIFAVFRTPQRRLDFGVDDAYGHYSADCITAVALIQRTEK